MPSLDAVRLLWDSCCNLRTFLISKNLSSCLSHLITRFREEYPSSVPLYEFYQPLANCSTAHLTDVPLTGRRTLWWTCLLWRCWWWISTVWNWPTETTSLLVSTEAYDNLSNSAYYIMYVPSVPVLQGLCCLVTVSNVSSGTQYCKTWRHSSA